MKKIKRIRIRLPEAEEDKLAILAYKENLSKSNLVRKVVLDFLREYEEGYYAIIC